MIDTEKEALCIRIDELCQEVEALKREKAYWELNKCLQCSNIDALLKSQVDNATLQEQLEYDRQTSRSRLGRIDQLKDENDKLRKLCADLRFCRRNNCLTCSHGRFCDMHFDERYAELKIEIG